MRSERIWSACSYQSYKNVNVVTMCFKFFLLRSLEEKQKEKFTGKGVITLVYTKGISCSLYTFNKWKFSLTYVMVGSKGLVRIILTLKIENTLSVMVIVVGNGAMTRLISRLIDWYQRSAFYPHLIVLVLVATLLSTQHCTYFLRRFIYFFFLLNVQSNMNNFYTYLFEPYTETQQVLALQIRMELGILTIVGYSTLPTSADLVLHHQIRFCVIVI